jgi:hypothetical protein
MSAQANLRMKPAAAMPAQGTRARALALTADRVAILSIVGVSLLLVLFSWNRWGDLSLDTGYDLVVGAKVSHLNAPYLDYQYWYGPLGALLLGAIYELVGIAIWPSVALGLVLAAAGLTLSYVLARRLAGPAAAGAAGVLVAATAFSTSNISWVQPHTFNAPLGVLCDLAVVLAAARYAQLGTRRWLVVAGLAAGLAATTRPEAFVAALLALAGWLAVRVLRATDKRAALREVATVAAGAVAIPAIAYGAFLVVGHYHHHSLTLGALVHDNLFPTGLLRESVSTVYRDLAPRTPGSFVTLAGKVVLYGAGIGATVGLARAIDHGGRRRLAALALCALVAAGVIGLLLGRPATLRFYLKDVFGWLPAGALIAAVLLARSALRDRAGDWKAQSQLELLGALMLFGFAYSAYAKFWPIPNPDFAQNSLYGMPFIAAFLAVVHARMVPRIAGDPKGTLRTLGTGWVAIVAIASAGLVIHDARQETYTVHGVAGTMKATPADGRLYQQVLDVIAANTRRSEAILLAPQMTSLYVLSDRGDMLPQLSLLPGALDGPAAEDRAIRNLEIVRVRLAVTDRTPLTRYGKGAFGVGYDRKVGAWLRTNFTHLNTLRGSSDGGAPRILDVWLRRTL